MATPKVCTVAYLPPNMGYARVFRENLESYRHTHPIILYSDSKDFGVNLIPNPGQAVGFRNVPLSINNYVFLSGMKLAEAAGYEYFLYLEEDCRVRGHHWDGKIFTEFFQTDGALMGGTPSMWNIGICGAANEIKALEWAWKYAKKTGHAPLIWQNDGRTGEQRGLWLYPNGAIGVYHIPTIKAIFVGHEYDMGTYCSTLGAWDVLIGKGMWNQFAMGTFDRFAIIRSVFSSYKDCHFGLHERKKLLTDGNVVAVHQIKDNWKP